jgi:hypothetical protein
MNQLRCRTFAPGLFQLPGTSLGRWSHRLDPDQCRRGWSRDFGNSAATIILSALKGHTPSATLVHSLFDVTPAEIAVAELELALLV